jgi:hypothetical protein
MILKTYLMNSTRKEYVLIGADYPSKTGEYLEKLEKIVNWNLTHDDIHINFSYSNLGFKDVKDLIYGLGNENSGGKIINEYIRLDKL